MASRMDHHRIPWEMSDRSTEPLTTFAMVRHGLRDPGQSYYWTTEWREAEREIMEEFRRGEYVSFASGAEAADWLVAD